MAKSSSSERTAEPSSLERRALACSVIHVQI